MDNNIRPIAIHLPQYHPFPENDKWWGNGFTEWTNVTKAKPKFKGHYQPHLPADLGFYDLRLEEARIAQADLAKQYGIYGFCYYHYWFNGKRLMNRPLDDMIKSKKPDFPFMLCWANENWSRRWDGRDSDILIEQKYTTEDDIAHIKFIINTFFSDRRYITVNGKPFFAIYKPSAFPNIKKTLLTWRNEAAKFGIELYIGYMKTFASTDLLNDKGFDCVIDFQPNLYNYSIQKFPHLLEKVKHRLKIKESPYYTNFISSYPEYVDMMLAASFKYNPSFYPGITPGWDNSARKSKNAMIYKDSTPEEYGRWLQHIKNQYQEKETFLFINAWNEWAEGNHLEPCQKWGRQYLEQTELILGGTKV